MSFLFVYITHPDEQTAQAIVATLVEEKMVACGNCFPIQSMYWWNGTVQKEGEWVSVVKTIAKKWQPLQRRIEDLHPYEVPCILKIEATANAAYEAWIRETVT